MGLWILTQGQQSETPGLYIGLKTLFSFRYFNIPLKMKDDPFRLIGVIGSIQVDEKCCPSHVFMLCFSISGSEVCDGSPAVVPRAHRESPKELLDAILG